VSNRFHGRQDTSKKREGQQNKGILRADRALKRQEAENRQALTDPRKTKAFRLGSSYDPSTGKRRPWKTPDWRRHDESVAALVATQREVAS
jgi:hypothetical protein